MLIWPHDPSCDSRLGDGHAAERGAQAHCRYHGPFPNRLLGQSPQRLARRALRRDRRGRAIDGGDPAASEKVARRDADGRHCATGAIRFRRAMLRCFPWIEGLERVKGIEPSSSAWKAVALPLSYTRDIKDLARCSAKPRQPLGHPDDTKQLRPARRKLYPCRLH
jgi:hypothetical protein